MSNNFNVTPTLDGLVNVTGDSITCSDLECDNATINKNMTVKGETKTKNLTATGSINLASTTISGDLSITSGLIQLSPLTGARISYDTSTRNLNIRSGTTNSTIALDTYDSTGTNLRAVNLNTSRAIIQQPYLEVGIDTPSTTPMRVYGSGINGVGKSGFMLTSVNAGGGSNPASVPMGLLNVIDELFDIAINCGNVAATRKTSNQGIQMRFDSRNTEPLWALQCVERVTGTVRNSAQCTDTGVFQIPNRLDLLLNANMNQSGTGIISQLGTGTNTLKATTITSNNNLTMSGTGVILQTGTGSNSMKSITMNVDSNFTQSGNGTISQTGGGINSLKPTNFFGSIDVSGSILQNGLPYAPQTGSILLTSDNTSGTYYIPYSKSTAGTNPLFIDDATNPFTINPQTGLLTLGATSSALNLATSYFGCRGDTTSNYIGVNVAAGATTAAQRNVYIGNNAGAGTTNGGSLNVLIGFEAGKVNNESHNVAVGYQSLLTATANQNVAVGSLADNFITTGAQNTSVGYNSGAKFVGTASFNTCIGRNSGNAMKGSNNTAIGASAYSTDNGTFSNSTAIGFNAQVTASNQIVLGTATERVRIPNVIDFGDITTQKTAYRETDVNACDILTALSGLSIQAQTWNWTQSPFVATGAQNVYYFSAIKLIKGVTYTGMGMFIVASGGGNVEFALYDSGLGAARLATTGTFATVANQMNFKAFTTPYTPTITGIYYVAHRLPSTGITFATLAAKNETQWNYAPVNGTLAGLTIQYAGTAAFPANIPTGQAMTRTTTYSYVVLYS